MDVWRSIQSLQSPVRPCTKTQHADDANAHSLHLHGQVVTLRDERAYQLRLQYPL